MQAIEFTLVHGQQLSYLGKNMECARQMKNGIQLTNDLISLVLENSSETGARNEIRVCRKDTAD